jgi:hypothetical protein
VDLREALAGVQGYQHTLGKNQAAQQHLWQIPREAPPEIPLGLRVRVSGSAINLPIIPWIALMDPDVTTTATEGLYLVYLFDRTLGRVYLSMNQGVTQHLNRAREDGATGRAAETAAIAEIADETTAMRALLSPEDLAGTVPIIDLGDRRFLPAAYEAGNIAALTYQTAALPSTSELARELGRFAQVYAQCVAAKDSLAANQRVRTGARESVRAVPASPPPIFRPKSADDYVAHLAAQEQKRTRSHEALVKAFGEAVLATGRVAVTNVHPRDLTIEDGDEHWLVECKIVGANPGLAVREAIAQLFTYRHFYYRVKDKPEPRLLAVFDSPIGDAFHQLLESLGIIAVVRDVPRWVGGGAGVALTTLPDAPGASPTH